MSATKSHCLKSSRAKVVTQTTIMKWYQHFGKGYDPVPVKFGPKCTNPNRKDARFTFHALRVVQSAIAAVPSQC